MSATIKLSSPATREFWEIPVLYEDAHLLAIDKPAGLQVSPDPSQPDRPSLTRLLHDGIKRGAPWTLQAARPCISSPANPAQGAPERLPALGYLAPAHRLDAESSGVLLLAKSKPVLIALLNYFGIDRPGRRFVALVRGTPLEDRFQVELKMAPFRPPLGPSEPARPPGENASVPAPTRALPLMRADSRRGKRSITLFEVRQKFARYTLVQCEPLTDRPHQIRVHLRSLRLSVLGDLLYGGRLLMLSTLKRDYHLKPNKTERPLISQPALHAESISLPHPVTGEALTIPAPWPKHLTVALKYLNRYAVQ